MTNIYAISVDMDSFKAFCIYLIYVLIIRIVVFFLGGGAGEGGGVFFFISKGTAHDFYLRMISIQYNDGDTHLYFLQNNIATTNFLFQIHSGLRICSKK